MCQEGNSETGTTVSSRFLVAYPTKGTFMNIHVQKVIGSRKETKDADQTDTSISHKTTAKQHWQGDVSTTRGRGVLNRRLVS